MIYKKYLVPVVCGKCDLEYEEFEIEVAEGDEDSVLERAKKDLEDPEFGFHNYCPGCKSYTEVRFRSPRYLSEQEFYDDPELPF